MEKSGEIIGTLLSVAVSVFAALIVIWKDWLLSHLKDLKGKTFQKNLEIRKDIDAQLYSIMEKMGANRCCFYEFSNGESSLSSVPFQYMRMTFEKTDSLIKSIQKDLEKVSVNLMIISLSKMNLDTVRHYSYDDTDEEEIRRLLKHYKAKQEIRIKVGKRLEDGMIGLWYHSDYHDLTDEEIEYLYQKGYEIKIALDKLKKAH